MQMSDEQFERAVATMEADFVRSLVNWTNPLDPGALSMYLFHDSARRKPVA